VVERNQKEQMKNDNERAGTPAVAVQRLVRPRRRIISHLHAAFDARLRTPGYAGTLRLLEPLYLLVRLLQVRTKILVLRLERGVLLFQSRHLRFCVRQSLSQNCGKRNLFQYVSDYAHSVLMWSNSISVEVSRPSSVWFLTLDACKKPLSMPIIG